MKRLVVKQVVRYRDDISINFVTGVSRLRRRHFSRLKLECGHTVDRPGSKPINRAKCKQCPEATAKIQKAMPT